MGVRWGWGGGGGSKTTDLGKVTQWVNVLSGFSADRTTAVGTAVCE